MVSLEATTTLQVGTGIVIPSVSIGVAACPECDPADPAALIATADQALYAAKKSGGNKGKVVAAVAVRPVPPRPTAVPTQAPARAPAGDADAPAGDADAPDDADG